MFSHMQERGKRACLSQSILNVLAATVLFTVSFIIIHSLTISFTRDSSVPNRSKVIGVRWQCVQVLLRVWGRFGGEQGGNTWPRRGHNHASCVWFGTGCQDLSLCASQTFLPGLSNPPFIPPFFFQSPAPQLPTAHKWFE